MRKNTEPLDLTFGANGLSTVCQKRNTLRTYDIYYINPWRGMNSPRVLLLRKMGFIRTGVMEFIFSHAWHG
jgi:hypothetical protein